MVHLPASLLGKSKRKKETSPSYSSNAKKAVFRLPERLTANQRWPILDKNSSNRRVFRHCCFYSDKLREPSESTYALSQRRSLSLVAEKELPWSSFRKAFLATSVGKTNRQFPVSKGAHFFIRWPISITPQIQDVVSPFAREGSDSCMAFFNVLKLPVIGIMDQSVYI